MTTPELSIVQGLFDADWQSRLVKNESNKVLECWQNVYVVLEHHPEWKGKLGFDDFAQGAVKHEKVPTGAAPGPWMAEDDTRLGLWLAQQCRLALKSVATISTGVLAAAQAHKFHPVRDWLESLAWDKSPRLDRWLHECLGAKEDAYTAAVGRYFLLNMVARVYEPGCIMRTVPVLEGRQERGKSTALRILADPWFSDAHLDLASKDAYELIQGVWLQEIPEMHAFNRAEANRVKQFISLRADSWVPKYIRGKVTVPRQVCIAGSTNESSYLKDWTGNTRFHPFRCEAAGEIDLEALAGMREQLFAEAVVRWKARERRYPSAEENAALFEPEQAQRLIEHPWVEPIAKWCASHTSPRVTMAELLHEACKVEISKQTVLNTQDVGRIMSGLGWARKRGTDGGREWFYERPAPAVVKASESGQGGGDDAPF